MAEQRYGPNGPGSYIETQLAGEIVAAGLPAPVGVYGSGYPSPGSLATAVEVGFDPALTGPQETTLNGVVAAHVPVVKRQPRTFLAILASLIALTSTQKTAIGADLYNGTTPKWSLNTGPNRSGLATLYSLTQLGGLSAADKNLVKLHGAALYVQDNPKYLVNPSFDVTINVTGDEPVT